MKIWSALHHTGIHDKTRTTIGNCGDVLCMKYQMTFSIDVLEIYEWTTDWSDYFDAGHEWYGACCWSVYDRSMNRYVVMLVSATD